MVKKKTRSIRSGRLRAFISGKHCVNLTQLLYLQYFAIGRSKQFRIMTVLRIRITVPSPRIRQSVQKIVGKKLSKTKLIRYDLKTF